MRIDVEVELKDAPGQLTGVLDTIGRYGGNIVTVLHDRSRMRNGRVPVLVAFDAPEEGRSLILEHLRREYRVLRAEGGRDQVVGAFLLVGHVIQSGLEEVTEAVFGAGAEVRRVRVDVDSRDAPSAILLDVTAPGDAVLQKAVDKVRDIGVERGYTLVDALKGEGR